MPEMLFDDFIEIGLIHIGVPGGFRINHDDRPFVATIHAPGGINADIVIGFGNAKFLDLVLHVVACPLGSKIAATIAAVLPLIGTEKYMLVEITHCSTPESMGLENLKIHFCGMKRKKPRSKRRDISNLIGEE
jgi:hypothetical protein